MFGSRFGFQTLLVLTGVTTLKDVKALQKSSDKSAKEMIPDVYLEKLGDITKLIS